jgi:putative transposase
MITMHKHIHGVRPLCQAFAESPASYYRSIQTRRGEPQMHQPSSKSIRCGELSSHSPRALCDEERKNILDIMNSQRFCDLAPGEIHATLLDEGTYLCSERTMYRILVSAGENQYRRQSPPRAYVKPELLATKPNQLWSWDITKLRGTQKWTYYYLYKILDVFSRYVVGWMVAYRERASLAEDLIADSCLKQNIVPGQLTVHSDNGSVMISHSVAQLLMDLGVAKTHSRPHVSNDNPYSESAFKTLKYRPDFPGYFGCIEDARAFCVNFFSWYNKEHHHGGIALLTPESVHYGYHGKILHTRTQTMNKAYSNHPERFVKGSPRVKPLPTSVWINKPTVDQSLTPDDQSVIYKPTIDHYVTQDDQSVI